MRSLSNSKIVVVACLILLMLSAVWLNIGSIVYAANTISVTGRFTFAGGEPVRHAYVEVMDSEVGRDEMRISGYTDSDGYYIFSGLNNDDGLGQGGRDIYVKCYARNWAADVISNPRWMANPALKYLWDEGETYSFRTSTKDDVDDGDVDMGTKDAPGDVDEAFNVFDTINKGYDFLAGRGLDPGQVTVFWDDWFTPWDPYFMPWSIAERISIPDDWVAFIAVLGALTWATWWWGPVTATIDITFEEVLRSLRGIHLKDGDGWDERIVLHEYGHFVMEKYADLWPPDSKLDHKYDQAYDPEHAWVEGWAHFFSAAVRHWAGYPKADYTGNRPIEYVPGTLLNYQGDSVEAAVAGVLWDIYDSDNEPGDTLSLGFDPIWDILTTYNPPGDADHPWNIYDFWDGWYASHWWQWFGYRYSLWKIFGLHNMYVPADTTPPSNPEISRMHASHGPYVWSGDNTVEVMWVPAADDISGAKDYLVIWDNSPATVPELNDPGTTLVTDTRATSPPLLGADWWFHVRTRDYAGNWAIGATHYGPFYIEAEISISVIPTTIISGYHYGARSPTIIGSTTLPPGSVIKLKIAAGPGGGDPDRVEEYEAWSQLPSGHPLYVINATVDSQGQFTAQFDAGDMRGRWSAIALWYDGSRYWHNSDRFEFGVEGLWIHLEVIPDTIYPNEPAMIFGSTNLPPGTEWTFIYWATHVWPYTPTPESPRNKVVVDPDGNFMDVYAPPPGGWTEGEWAVSDELPPPVAYFQVVPLPPPKISITPSTATLQPTLGSSVTYAISIQNDARAWPIQNDFFHPGKPPGTGDTFSVSLIPPQASDLYGAGWEKLDFQYQTWLTVPRGQTRVMNLTVMAKGEPVLLGDYEFGVSASYISWPRSTNTTQATLRIDFIPTLPAAPTGDLAIAVQPKTTYMPTGTSRWMRNITVINNQNFNDTITVEITNSGIPIQNQADLNWFTFPRWTAGVYIPAGQSVKIPLLIDVPAGTPSGMYIFRAVAGSTADFAATAEDSGTIIIGDTTPPNIIEVSQFPLENNVLPEDEVEVNSTVTDDLSGVKRVTLNYTIGNGTWIIVDMTNIEGNIWNGAIPNFPDSTNVTYVIEVEDNVNNTITTEDMGYEYQYRTRARGNTPVGNNVQITEGETTITFSDITEPGDTSITSSDTNPGEGLSNFRFLGTYYDVTSTASYEGSVTICIEYDDTGMPQGRERNLKLFHWDGTNWIEITTSLDTDANIICGTVQSLSWFSVAYKQGIPNYFYVIIILILIGIFLVARAVL